MDVNDLVIPEHYPYTGRVMILIRKRKKRNH